MGRSAEEVSPSVVAEGRTVRRRLIQSTLFPHKSPAKEIEEVPDGDCSQLDTVEGEGQLKIKRKRGRPPKVSSPNKQITSKCERLGETMENRSSPFSDHDKFLDKNSRGQLTRQRQKKQQSGISPESRSPSKPVGSLKSPRKSKKQQICTTPSKSIQMNNLKEPCSKESSIDSVQTQPALQLIPDLRLEAKMTAEENSRIFAGKKIHPFFSSRKPIKRFEGIPESEGYPQCSVDVKNKDYILGPIHVVDIIQEDVVSPDWRNWVFCETPFSNRQCDQNGTMSSFFEDSQKSLNIGNFKSQHQSSPSSLNGIALDVKEVYSCAGNSIPSIGEGKKAGRIDEVIFSSRHAVHLKSTVQVDHGECPEDRQSYSPYHSTPNDSLWTEKYHPESAAEVCGNSESVKLLSEWLHLWHERAYQSTKELVNGERGKKQDVDPNYYDSDCDSEFLDEGSKLKNILLVTGPVGSGKSAAIYACALEQGFKVIEVNTSDWRNGALLKQKFGEAVESHRLKWSRESHQSPQCKPIKNAFPALSNKKFTEEFDEVVEIIPVLDNVDDNQEGTGMTSTFGMDSRTACGQGEIKSLVLFEDVDITFYEDKGFIAAIQQLAETAKLPMILTANSNYPVLPESLARLELFFVMPSPEELYYQVCKVCAAEKANVNPHVIEQYIRYFHRDIRKTIMHLQFWCQDEGSKKDKAVHRVCGPLIFDIEAGHLLLEKMIPWDFPSQLAQLIEIEISKSLLPIEDHFIVYNVFKEDNVDVCNDLGMPKNETDSLEAKKEVMLSRNLSAQNDIPCKSSELSGSPVAFTRRNVRRKLDALLSFSSEDELPDAPLHEVQEARHNISFDIDLNYPPPSPKRENCINHASSQYGYSDTRTLSLESKNLLHPFPDLTLYHDKGYFLNNDLQCSDIATNSRNCWSSRLDDVSCVPESSFVLDSEMNDTAEPSEAVSSFNVPIVQEASTGSESLQNSSPIAALQVESICQLPQDSGIVGIGCDVNGKSAGTEEVSDLHEQMQAATREFKIVDECSRIDFSKSRTLGKPISRFVTESIQDTWKNIRLLDLGEYVDSEQNEFFRVVELAYGISDFISEADLLFSWLDMQDKDSWERNLYEDFDAPHWYNTQLQMTSAVSERGFFLYTKGLASAGSEVGLYSDLNLSQQIVCTDDTITFSKTSQDIESEGVMPSKRCREMNSSLVDTVQSLVPVKSYFTVKGDSFHEYLSSLNQIRRSEDSRLTLNQELTTRRRTRVARHYLSMLSPEDVALLERYNRYGKFSFQPAEA